MGTVEAPAAPPRAGRSWRRLWADPDRRALGILVAVPALVFIVPALAGHPAIAGDNVIQNFPLRWLTGRIIRSGHLPLWNPLIWSGSPLLGGMNAGSFYPGTLIFVVLPGIVAWVANLLAIYWAAGIGLYVLSRRFGIAPLPALLAAATYAYSGAMAGQMVHLGIVQGFAWMPWIVLVELELVAAVLGPSAALRRRRAAGPGGVPGEGGAAEPTWATATSTTAWPWVLALAVLIGLVFLTGEPRAIAETEIVAPLVALYGVLRPYPGRPVRWAARAKALVLVAVGGCWAAAIGASQLIVGLHFINESQRAQESISYYGAGSLRPIWTVLLAVPDIFGGDGALHMPAYFNNYNLPEVTGYVGLLPLVAAVALAVGLFTRRRDPDRADIAFWIALCIVGLLLAFGTYTPLGSLFWHIPLFGKTRLQSRNLGIVDLALAVLLGYWADRLFAGRLSEAGLAGRRRVVVLLPVAAAALACAVALAVPARLEQAFDVAANAVGLGRDMTPWFILQLALAVAVGGLLVTWCRWSPRARRRALCGLLVVDIGLFTLTSSSGLASGHVTLEPNRATAVSVLGVDGRFAMFDTSVQNLELMSSLGQPDLNAFTDLPSVQGYGSLVDDSYGTATGTHTLDTLDACALAEGVFTQLRLSSLVTLPAFVAPELSPVRAQRSPPPSCPDAPLPGTTTARTWYLGRSLPVARVSLVQSARVSGVPRLGVLEADGAVTWPTETVSRSATGWEVTLLHPADAVGLVVHGPARSFTDASTVATASGAVYALDGYLQDALGQNRWHYDRLLDGGVIFKTASVLPPLWIRGHPAGASVHQVTTTIWGETVASVHASRPVTVVRSESALPGWKVTAEPEGGGPSRTLEVRPTGLVQSVAVPAGNWILTYTYDPSGVRLGLVGSAAGVALAVVGAGALVVRRRRRGRASEGAPDRVAR